MATNLKTYIARIAVAAILLLTAPGIVAAPPTWETLPSTASLELSEGSTLEVAVRGTYVYLTLAQPAEVQVISILGQPVSRQKLKAGTARLRIARRGIYILKVGAETRRITI